MSVRTQPFTGKIGTVLVTLAALVAACAEGGAAESFHTSCFLDALSDEPIQSFP